LQGWAKWPALRYAFLASTERDARAEIFSVLLKEIIMAKKAIFKCLECGKKLSTVKDAEKASFGDNGCPGCGGSNIDTA